MRFITDATRLREFGDVIWAANHYGHHYSPDLTVDLCTIVAYAGLGEMSRALHLLRHSTELSSDVRGAADKLSRLLGCKIEFHRENPQAFLAGVVAAVESKRRKAGRGRS